MAGIKRDTPRLIETVALRVTEQQLAKIRTNGGAAWLRELIDTAPVIVLAQLVK